MHVTQTMSNTQSTLNTAIEELINFTVSFAKFVYFTSLFAYQTGKTVREYVEMSFPGKLSKAKELAKVCLDKLTEGEKNHTKVDKVQEQTRSLNLVEVLDRPKEESVVLIAEQDNLSKEIDQLALPAAPELTDNNKSKTKKTTSRTSKTKSTTTSKPRATRTTKSTTTKE